MKAIVYRRYGPPDVLALEDVEKPAPGDDEVLIEVKAVSVNPIDYHLMRGTPHFGRVVSGLRGPKVQRLGHDLAGRVEAAGKNATHFKPGDEVFGTARGALAEYAVARASGLALKPPNATFEQAAAAPVAGYTALQSLRKGGIRAGAKVLINGAAGGVGTFAVQFAKILGAEVTGVCSTRNVDMVRSLGADHVIDYTRDDFTQRGERCDLIIDCIGNHPFSAYKRILTPNGVCMWIGGQSVMGAIARAIASRFTRQKLKLFLARVNQTDLIAIRDFLASGQVVPVIDNHYALRDAAEAMRHLETGHARGKVIVTIP